MKNNIIRPLFALLLLQIAAAFAYANGPGSLDLTFNGTGYAALPLDSTKDIVIQPDGKILVLVNNTLSSQTSVSRFNPDGALDASFGNGGRLSSLDIFGINSGSGSALLLLPDGKIIFAGLGYLIRLNYDGTRDTTFGVDGRARVDYGGHGGSILQAALSPNGKITVSGRWVDPRFSAQYGGTARFNSDGSSDTSFGEGGSLGNFEPGLAFSFQPDGKMIAGSGNLSVLRYNADGSPDTSFDGDGRSQAPPLPGNAGLRAMALSPDGKILAAGSVRPDGNNSDFGIVRYNSDGSLDTSFNGTGEVFTPILAGTDSATGISLQSDGKIVVSGIAQRPNNGSDMALVRYNIDGSLDTTYGSNGKVVIDFGASENNIHMALDASDKAVVGGQSQTAFIARLTSEAAPLVDVGGKITSTNGQGIGGATVVLTDSGNQKRYALTNAFGYYGFSGVSSNEVYTVGVSNKRYRFQPSSQSITLLNSLANVDFVGNPGSESLVEAILSKNARELD